jgi:uncharacterized protein (TIGR02453 family)
MIEKSTLDFLKKLGKNNNREWYHANKDLYEKAKANIEDFTMVLLNLMAEFEPSVAGRMPDECLFRIYRDTRFSNDKTPYKTNFGIALNNKKSSGQSGVFYVHIEPGSSAVYCGAHLPEPQFLLKIRKNIENRFDEFKKIINASDFRKFYEEILADTLKNVPRGFNKESRAAEYLKFKEYIVGSGFTDAEVLSADFVKAVVRRLKAAKKSNDFIAS